MDSATVSAAIAGAVAVTVAGLTAGLTYVLTKRREHESEWRKIKLDLYKSYVIALSGVVRHDRTIENQAQYADAVNSLTLVGSPAVLKALYAFQDDVSDPTVSANKAILQRRVEHLLNALREDIHPYPRGQSRNLTFRFMEPPPRQLDA